MVTRDGGLRQLFSANLKDAHWQSVETGGTGMGVPDAEFCFPGGYQGWVEFKRADATAVGLRPEQVAWIDRRARMEGSVFVAVRRQRARGVRVAACDELHLYLGRDVKKLALIGLDLKPAGLWTGGPVHWDWEEVRAILRRLTN